MTETAISFRDVSKVFSARGRVVAVQGLSFDIARGDYVCVVGRTGCGKSTTINLLLGIEKPTSGSVSVLGLDPHRQFNGLRGKVGCVFQSDRLLPWRSAIDNVRVPLEIIGLQESTLSETPAELLERLGLKGFENAYPQELSGGMRQRVALARALVSNPDVLLADEAFGHLDEVTGGRLRKEFWQLAKDTGKTVLHITHSIDEAISLSDRVLVFGRPGHVAADIRIAGARDGAQREIWRRDIVRHIEGAEEPRQTSTSTAAA